MSQMNEWTPLLMYTAIPVSLPLQLYTAVHLLRHTTGRLMFRKLRGKKELHCPLGHNHLANVEGAAAGIWVGPGPFKSFS